MKGSTRVFLGLLRYELVKGLVKRLTPVSTILAKNPQLAIDLKKTDIILSPTDYVGLGLVNYFFGSLLVAGITYSASVVGGRPTNVAIALSLASFMAMFLLFTVLLLRMPSVQAKSQAAKTEQSLLFALQDLLLQINSGVTLYQSMVSVSESNYGEISNLFQDAAKKVNTGTSMQEVIKDMIAKTESEYLRRALWQMSASLRAGADLRRTLATVISELNQYQKAQIEGYARELNLWSLGYMLFAVAIPTIGSTMLVILSTFAGFGVTNITFIFFVTLSFLIQVVMVFFVKSRRPVVQF